MLNTLHKIPDPSKAKPSCSRSPSPRCGWRRWCCPWCSPCGLLGGKERAVRRGSQAIFASFLAAPRIFASGHAVPPFAAGLLVRYRRQAQMLLERLGECTAHGVGLPAGGFANLADGCAFGTLEHPNQTGLLAVRPRAWVWPTMLRRR